VVFLPDAFSLLCGSAFEATAHDEAHNAFMTLPAYTRTSEGKVHQLGSGPTPCRLGRCVSNSSRSASSEPLPEKSKSIERACEGTSAGDPARCAFREALHVSLGSTTASTKEDDVCKQQIKLCNGLLRTVKSVI